MSDSPASQPQPSAGRGFLGACEFRREICIFVQTRILEVESVIALQALHRLFTRFRRCRVFRSSWVPNAVGWGRAKPFRAESVGITI